MAEFGANITEAPQIQSVETPQDGVVGRPVFLEGLNDLFGTAKEIISNNKASRQEALISDFTERQLKWIQAVDQGEVNNTQFARTNMRKNLIEMIDAHPGLRQEIIQANASVLGIGGMGDIITRGTQAEIRQRAFDDQLVSSGQVSANAGEEEFKRARSNAQMAMEADRRYKMETQTLAIEKARTDLSSSQQQLLKQREQQAFRQFVVETTPAQMDAFNGRIKEISENPNLTDAEKQQTLNDYFIGLKQGFDSLRGQLDDSHVNAIEKTFTLRHEAGQKVLRGEWTTEAAKAEIDRIQNTQQALLLQEPAFATAYALSKILPNTDVASLSLDVRTAVSNYWAKNVVPADPSTETANPFTSDKVGLQGLKKYLSDLTDADLTSPEQLTEQTNHLSNIIASVEDFEGVLKKDPKSGIALVEWMASQKFFKARQANPEAFGDVEPAREVLQRHYADEVYDLVAREFRNNTVVQEPEVQVSGMGGVVGVNGKVIETPTADSVTFAWTPNGVKFTAMNPNVDEAVTKAKSLNNKLAPAINSMVRGFAHINGDQNYQAVFDELSNEIFRPDSIPVGGIGGGDVGDELKTSDFLGSGNTEIEVARFPNPSRFKSGGKMRKVEGMIIHHTGGRGDADHIADVLTERGLSVQYVIDRDAKVHQFLPDDTVAFHAGKSNNSGFDNNNSVGVEIIARDDADVTDAQIEAARTLANKLGQKHGFSPAQNVFGHGEVATHKRPKEGSSVVSRLRNG